LYGIFLFNDTATTEIYTLSLHDALSDLHWFPRLAVYNDVYGWQHKQFIGQGEFTLNFGNYKVAITVPNDHIVGASGELQNATQVMSATQLKRWDLAKTAVRPVVIVTQAEAEKAEKNKPTGKKTWVYKADNVRDFAFTSSRKFIWDAMQVDVEGKKVWAMSYYSKEGNPLWEKYSTMAVAHTLKSYSILIFPLVITERPQRAFSTTIPSAYQL